MSVTIEIIKKEEIPTVFPLVKDDLSRAFEYLNGRFSERDIFDYLLNEKMYLLLVCVNNQIKSSVITLVSDYPSKKVMTIMSLVGEDIDYWLPDLIKFLDIHAKDKGCDILEIVGRLGWINKLKEFGFNGQVCFLEKGV